MEYLGQLGRVLSRAVLAPILQMRHTGTGAGDTFAGGFMGFLASVGAGLGDADADSIRRAGVVGSAMASFTVEDFGLDRLRDLSQDEINDRFRAFTELTSFQPLEIGQSLQVR